jgi:hypothetical protein
MDNNTAVYTEVLNVASNQIDLKDLVRNTSENITEKLEGIEAIVSKPVEPPVVVVPDTVSVNNFPETQRVEVTNPTEIDFTSLELLLGKLVETIPTIKDERPTEAIEKLTRVIASDESNKEVVGVLRAILEREYPTFEIPPDLISKEGRLKVEVDRAGRGGTGDGIKYLVGMEIPAHDYLELTEATLTDTWVYKSGGASGATVATLVITYTDSGKGTIANVTKT